MAFLHRLNPFTGTNGKGQPKQLQPGQSEEYQGLNRPSTSLSLAGSDGFQRVSSDDSSTARYTTRSRTPSKLRSVLSHSTFQPSQHTSPSTTTLEARSPSLFQRSLSKRHKLKPSTSAPFLSLLPERPSTPSPRRLSRKRSTKTPTKDQIGTPQAPGAYAFKTWHSNAHLRTPGRPDSPSITLDLSLDLEVQEDLMSMQYEGRWKRTARRLGLSTPERAALIADEPPPPVPTLPKTLHPIQHPHPPPLPAKDYDDDKPQPIIPLAYLEQVPTGTPGGHRKDLAKGVLRDDIKSSNDQVRFFSRDMYSSARMTSLSPSPSPSPTPSPRPLASSKVAQRVSVDACGTPIKLSLPPSPERHVNYYDEEEEEEDEDPIRQHGIHLDTIDESSVNSASPTTPRQTHSSAPPSNSFSASLLGVHAAHTVELQKQLETSLALVEELQRRLEESEEIKRLAREVSEENDELQYAVGEVERLQGRLDVREESLAVSEQELRQQERDNEVLRIELQEREDFIVTHAEQSAQLRSDLSTAHIVIAFQDSQYEDILLRLEGRGELQEARVEAALSTLESKVKTSAEAGLIANGQASVTELRIQLDVAHQATAVEQARHTSLLDALESRGTTHEDRAAAIISTLQAGSYAQDRMIDLERDVAALQDKLGTTRFTRDELAVRLEAVESESYASRIELESSKLRATALEEELVVAQLAVKQSMDRAEELQRKVERLDEALDREIDVATRERQTSASRFEEIATELRAAVEGKAQAETACDEIREQLDAALEEITALRQELDDAQSELHDARNENIGLMENALQLEQAQEELSRLMMAGEDVEELSRDLANAHQEIARLEELCAALEMQPENDYQHEALVSSLNGDIQALQAQEALLKAQRKTLEDDFRAAQDALANKTQQLAALRNEADELQRAVADAEEALVQAHEDAERQHTSTLRQIARLETAIEDFKMEKATQDEALASATKSISTERMQLAEANSRCQAYKEQVERSYADERRRRDEVAQLRRESADAEMRITGLEKLAESLKEDKERLDIALDSKQQELEMIKRRYAVKGLTTPARSLSRTVPTTTSTPRHTNTPDDTPVPLRRMTLSSSTFAPGRHPLGSSTKSNMSPPVFKSKLKSPVRRMSLAGSIGKPRPSLQRERSLVVEESTEDEA